MRIFILSLGVIGICFFIIFRSQSYLSLKKHMQTKWDLLIPEKGEISYVYDGSKGFFSDGVKYYVVDYKNMLPAFDPSFDWKEIGEVSINNDGCSAYFKSIAKTESIPKERWPNFDDCRVVDITSEDDRLLLFFDKSLNRLFIFELYI